MKNTKNFKNIKNSLFVAFLLTMVGALMIGGATVAWFTDEAVNNGNSFAAGTLDISLDRPDGTHYFDITNIAPGDSGNSELIVKNDGSLPFNYSFSLTTDGGLFSGETPLIISIVDAQGNLIDSNHVLTLKPTDSHSFKVAWTMPENADNFYQGQSGKLGIGVSAEQITN